MSRSERQSRIRELLTDMGLWERRKERAGTWSEGMRQKLALARALLHRPALALLDEPTAGLDVMAANAVRDDLAALASQGGVTVFLTTHNMAEAERLCSQVAVIREGKLVAVGNPDKLRAQAGGPRVEIFGRGGPVWPAWRGATAIWRSSCSRRWRRPRWSRCWWAQAPRWKRCAGARPAWKRSS